MPYPKVDRSRVRMRPLAERRNKQDIERDHVHPEQPGRDLAANEEALLEEAVSRVKAARAEARPVMMVFGAHAVKNGLGPVLIRLLREGWLTHLATNGAGIIHDWEFAWQGQSSENVAYYLDRGEFGHWEETGYYINLALNLGAYYGLGYGEAVGALIARDGVDVPSVEALRESVRAVEDDAERAAAAADLLGVMNRFQLRPGWLEVPHGWKGYSIQAAAYEAKVPFTGHPMIGHDIIYNHPMNHGAHLGRVALRDYLTFAEAVSRMEGGVYFSLGSAIMSPMVFEKSMSMARNLARQRGGQIANHYVLVVDLAPSRWDWRQGEPPEEHPEYYMRYNKSFSRVGGTMRYLSMDNRDFLLHLFGRLTAPA